MRVLAVEPGGTWDTALKAGHVTLASDLRHRRRLAMQADEGFEFLLDLVHATYLKHGDGLALEDGRYIEVRAAPEPVLDIACDDAAHLARLAWHVGNRHLAVQVLADGTLRLADDYVIADMARHLGAKVRRHEAAFDPEPGAYAEHKHGK